MKAIVLFALALSLYACTSGPKVSSETSWEKMNLKGKIKSIQTLTWLDFQESGHVVYLDPAKPGIPTLLHLFNQTGLLLETIEPDPFSFTYRTTYEYNDQQLLVGDQIFRDDSLLQYSLYEYGEDRFKRNVYTYQIDRTSGMKRGWKTRYENNGKDIIRETTYRLDRLKEEMVIDYFSIWEDGKLVEKIGLSEAGDTLTTYTCDYSKERKVEMTSRAGDTLFTNNRFNQNGDIIYTITTQTKSNGRDPQKEYQNDYLYDSHKNWIQQTYYRLDPETKTWHAYRVEKRIIEYY